MKGHPRAGDTKWDPQVQGHIFITLTKDGRILLRYEDNVRPPELMPTALASVLTMLTHLIEEGKYNTTDTPEYRAIDAEYVFEAYKV